MKAGLLANSWFPLVFGVVVLTTTLSACGDGDGDAGESGEGSSSQTAGDGDGDGDGDTRGDGDGDGDCVPSTMQPGVDANGPYGPCASRDDCGPDAHTCNKTCGGACSDGCQNDDECPAAGDYPVECRPSASGSDPTGDCIITCDATADCPAGMVCELSWYCVWAGG